MSVAMVHRIDAHDHLVEFDAAFCSFAAGSGVPELPMEMLGRPLWETIGDPGVRAAVRALVTRARAGEPVTVATRCDSPSLIRFVELTITSNADGEVQFTSQLTGARFRHAPAAAAIAAAEPLRMCAWCFRVDRDGWRDVEAVAADSGLLARAARPVVAHGICPTCLNDRLAEIGAAA